MNKQRRGEISKSITKIEEIKEEIERIKLDEEFAFDSMPENLQYSERGEQSEESIDLMDEVIEMLDEAISKLEEITL